MKPSGIGGMAVIEGIMMKNKDDYAIAIRKSNDEIVVDKKEYKNLSDKIKIFRLPILRGVAAFIDSLVMGVGILNYSASFFEEEDTKDTKKKSPTKTQETLYMVATVATSIVLAVVLFMIVPFLLSQLLTTRIENNIALSAIEGVIRLVMFVGYVLAISRMKEIKRVFMYHGAEHKAINCIENGFELTVDNVKWQSREHKRCGTSFMLYIMIISVIFFVFISVDNLVLRIVIRLLLVPVIAGISYEFIRFAGRSNSSVINILSKPGMLLQNLTTAEPDEDMIEVAIQSVEAVFDWRDFTDKDQEDVKDEPDKNNKEEDILSALDRYLGED